jgi:hypothetical protein
MTFVPLVPADTRRCRRRVFVFLRAALLATTKQKAKQEEAAEARNL